MRYTFIDRSDDEREVSERAEQLAELTVTPYETSPLTSPAFDIKKLYDPQELA